VHKVVFATSTDDSTKHAQREVGNQFLSVKVLYSISCGKFDLV